MLAGLLFALHPICVESVAWISEQKNTLSGFFYLLAALAYLKFDRGRNRPVYFLALGLFILAILSKSVTATLPAALLVILWWQRGGLSWKRDVIPLLPWFAIGRGDGPADRLGRERRYVGAERGAALRSWPGCKGFFLLAARAICFYLGKLFWPANLIFVYPHWRIDAHSAGAWLFLLGVIALTVAFWLIRRRTRGPLAAWLFFAGSLFPALGFFNIYPFVYSYVADHFQYLASMGVIAAVAAGWGGLPPIRPGAPEGLRPPRQAVPTSSGLRAYWGQSAPPQGSRRLAPPLCLLGTLTSAAGPRLSRCRDPLPGDN